MAVPNPVAVNGTVALTAAIDDTATGGSSIACAEVEIDGGAFRLRGAAVRVRMVVSFIRRRIRGYGEMRQALDRCLGIGSLSNRGEIFPEPAAAKVHAALQISDRTLARVADQIWRHLKVLTVPGRTAVSAFKSLVGFVSRPKQAAPADRRPPGAVAMLEHRDDIQGLRAVAVLLVVLDHAGVSFLRGGFVGVDVFFVLSGFLITGILLSGAAKRGYVSLVGFYSRRARRILPAAALTLITTTIVAYQLLNYVRAKEAVWDSFWASLFAANIRLAHQGTDYFAQGQPPSLVQHYWSLAVEEQFYLVWPALLSIAVFGVSVGRRANTGAGTPVLTNWAIRRLLVVVILAASASLYWSIHYTNALPAAAYFSTFARAWELALGAALAIGSLTVARLSPSLRGALGWVGLIAIASAAITFSPTTPFPGYAALLPTLGTVLVIAAGVGPQQSRMGLGRLLSLSPLRYIGDRSYAFYLWHWPVLIIAVEYEGHELAVGVKLALVLGAFLLSIFTYRFFENPIRRARWTTWRSAMLIPASAAAVIVAAMVTLTLINDKILQLEKASAAASTATTESLRTGEKVPRSRPLPAVVAAVKAARRGAKIPSVLTPPISELLKDIYQFPSGCTPAGDPATTSNICRLGDPSSAKSIVLFGDSHAQMWMPTLLTMAEQDGWTVIPLVKSGCHPNAWIGPGFRGTPSDLLRACHAWYQWAVTQAKSLHPDVTLIAGCCPSPYPYPDARNSIRGFTSLATTMKRISTSVVVIADDDGVTKQPVDCLLARQATMKSCTTTPPANILAFNNNVAKVARTNKFGFLKTRGWFCYQNQCPMVVARTIVYRDTGHITKTYGLKLTAPFRTAFRYCIFDACPR
jgi:peptidoglycan/LPS O-acetylase OafA/YrhL